ncbi:MAG: class I SAM-dependent methyltransferase [Alphaproteobacteria bacterium]|nr:class I SAM-dependent methyltransferase [Alphaproteobacteria bacterium]
MGLATVLGLRARGVFIPYRHADALADDQGYPALAPLFAAAADRFAAVVAEIETHAAAFDVIARDRGPGVPRWDQDWFPPLDAAAAYTLIRRYRPRMIVEIGSGHSTRFLARAVADGGLATRLVAIDPAPRASLAGLAVDWRRTRLQDADPALFAAIGPGDCLFVDSSHVLAPGSDVDNVMNRILPLLPAGALVHIHDIFLPDPYPADWRWRGYGEQLAVATLLLAGGAAPLFASHAVATREAGLLARGVLARLPAPGGARPASLWLVKER